MNSVSNYTKYKQTKYTSKIVKQVKTGLEKNTHKLHNKYFYTEQRSFKRYRSSSKKKE